MVTCPRCGNPAILMASEEIQLLDCEFCDDVIDVSDQELPELDPSAAAWARPSRLLRVIVTDRAYRS